MVSYSSARHNPKTIFLIVGSLNKRAHKGVSSHWIHHRNKCELQAVMYGTAMPSSLLAAWRIVEGRTFLSSLIDLSNLLVTYVAGTVGVVPVKRLIHSWSFTNLQIYTFPSFLLLQETSKEQFESAHLTWYFCGLLLITTTGLFYNKLKWQIASFASLIMAKTKVSLISTISESAGSLIELQVVNESAKDG
jgi:hypothetical protein